MDEAVSGEKLVEGVQFRLIGKLPVDQEVGNLDEARTLVAMVAALSALNALAIDVMRAVRLEQHGYQVWTQAIPAGITPKNRLLLGQPDARRG